MAYTPVNLAIYTAALAGAAAGLGASSRVPSAQASTDPNDISIADIAESFAESLDTQWGVKVGTTADALQVTGVQQIAEAWWSARGYFTSVAAILPSTYTTFANALIAVVQAGRAAAIAQGVTPALVAPIVSGASNGQNLGVTNLQVQAECPAGGGDSAVVDTGYKTPAGAGDDIAGSVTFVDVTGTITQAFNLHSVMQNFAGLAVGDHTLAGSQNVGGAGLAGSTVTLGVTGGGNLSLKFTTPGGYANAVRCLANLTLSTN